MTTRTDIKCTSVNALPACVRKCDVCFWLLSRDVNCKQQGRQQKEDTKCMATNKIAGLLRM